MVKFVEIDSLDDIKYYAKNFGYPQKKLVLKPKFGRGSRGVIICDSNKKKYQDLILQSYIFQSILFQEST